MSFQFTDEQEAILLAAATGTSSLCVEALAGAAKTTTLVAAAHKLPLVPSLCCAFNKKIADEMGQRMPGHFASKTMNGLGHGVWGRVTGKRLTLNTDKMYKIVKEEIDKRKNPDLGEAFASILRATRAAKSSGYVTEYGNRFAAKSLVTYNEFLADAVGNLDCNPDALFKEVLDASLDRSVSDAYSGVIDFDDQIYMSALFGGNFPNYPIVLADEAQDLSALNHEIVRRIVGTSGRLIAVGDPYQAIYGFRGAHYSSIEVLAEEFSMEKLSLSTSFRCPKAVVERARSRAPHMQYPTWAKDGLVQHLDEWSAANIPDGAAIICRNNAPLFTMAFRLIRAGRGVHMPKREIGTALIKLLKKMGKSNMPKADLIKAITDWETKELAGAHKARQAAIRDRAECLFVFADFGATLQESLAYAEHILNATGPILLMTGHGSKGLEFDTTFHLEPSLVPSKFARVSAEMGDSRQMEQELNLRYVIETRAKESLYLADLDSFAS